MRGHSVTSKVILEAKKVKYCNDKNPYHEHDDCVRIAMEFLDAQPLLVSVPPRHNRSLRYSLKSMVEHWAGRYVSAADVRLAGKMMKLKGNYPFYNIPIKKTKPHHSRLSEIPEAYTQRSTYEGNPEHFSNEEVAIGIII